MQHTTHQNTKAVPVEACRHRRKMPAADGQAVSYLSTAAPTKESDEHLAEGVLAIQRYGCGQVARSLPTTIVDEFIDRGSADLPVADRPGLRQLLARLEGGDITEVVVHTPERLTRDPESYTRLTRQIDATGARLVVADVDGENAGKALLYDLMVSISTAWSAERSRLAKAAWARRRSGEPRAVTRRNRQTQPAPERVGR